MEIKIRNGERAATGKSAIIRHQGTNLD
jgi:hypothetical protein